MGGGELGGRGMRGRGRGRGGGEEGHGCGVVGCVECGVVEEVVAGEGFGV